jgi:thiamine-monophosphate kinase
MYFRGMIEDANPQRTPISELGEFGLIKTLTEKIILKNPSTVFGVGDDAAVMNPGNEYVLTSTDMLVEGIHFDLSYVPLKHLGYKAAVVNFSDIYAMNGTPNQLYVSLALSNRFPIEAVEQIYEGIAMACQVYGVDLAGGDTTASQTGLILSLTVNGLAKKEDIVYRSGAKVNDLIVVTGDLGGAYMGLQVLEREKQVFLVNPEMQPELQGHEYVLERQLKPEARKDVPETLRGLGIKPTSMIDLSDGLSSDLLHICEASGVGCRIYEERLPIDPTVYNLCEEFNLNTTTVVLSGGEDYELLFTAPIEEHEKIQQNPHMTIIGHISQEKEGRFLISRANESIELKARGWNALLDKEQTKDGDQTTSET